MYGARRAPSAMSEVIATTGNGRFSPNDPQETDPAQAGGIGAKPIAEDCDGGGEGAATTTGSDELEEYHRADPEGVVSLFHPKRTVIALTRPFRMGTPLLGDVANFRSHPIDESSGKGKLDRDSQGGTLLIATGATSLIPTRQRILMKMGVAERASLPNLENMSEMQPLSKGKWIRLAGGITRRGAYDGDWGPPINYDTMWAATDPNRISPPYTQCARCIRRDANTAGWKWRWGWAT